MFEIVWDPFCRWFKKMEMVTAKLSDIRALDVRRDGGDSLLGEFIEDTFS